MNKTTLGFEIIEKTDENGVAGIYFNNTLKYPFLGEDIVCDQKYDLYAYVEITGDDLFIKFGEAVDTTIAQRYKATGATQSRRVVLAIPRGDEPLRDAPIHNKLKKISSHGYEVDTTNALNTVEAYKILNQDGLSNFISDVQYFVDKSSAIKKESREDYESIIRLCNQVLKRDSKINILDLCTRWGKTSTILRLCREYKAREDIRVFFLCSYVKTVKRSYSSEIGTIIENENCLFIDPDDYIGRSSEMETLISSWLSDAAHYIMYYVALTGNSSCNSRRVNALSGTFDKAVKITIFIEEADFGAHCTNQISKLKKLSTRFDTKHILVASGTNPELCHKIAESLC